MNSNVSGNHIVTLLAAVVVAARCKFASATNAVGKKGINNLRSQLEERGICALC